MSSDKSIGRMTNTKWNEIKGTLFEFLLCHLSLVICHLLGIGLFGFCHLMKYLET